MTKKIRCKYKKGDAIKVRTDKPRDSDIITDQIYEGIFNGRGHYPSADIKLSNLGDRIAFILIAEEGVCVYCSKDGKWEIVEDD